MNKNKYLAEIPKIIIVILGISLFGYMFSDMESGKNKVKQEEIAQKERDNEEKKASEAKKIAEKEKERSELLKLAKAGDKNAQLRLGILAMDDEYFSEATKWLSKADANGSTEAKDRLITIYSSYLMKEINQEGHGLNKAWVDYLVNASNDGSVSARLNLASYYFQVSKSIASKKNEYNADSVFYLQEAKRLLLGIDSSEARWGLSCIYYTLFFASGRFYPDGRFVGGNKSYLREAINLTSPLVQSEFDTKNSKFDDSLPLIRLESLYFYLDGEKPLSSQ
ncbi:TPA: hypothetical protein U2M58_004027, partial [Providencia stuartii]|uniref:hypothetical protein n=1 Tax=Providencia stuartii TaxID=588 RepID=UPI00198165D5|nr:hypothetical protein [Providencia stuartii]MBN5602915.1 hypothetical protein [Providencia stuartii]MBN5606942.1 hypothetical protein [Providencia stuartii]HEM8275013.1 hypothetical protein [Providencia stuartii]